MVYANGVEGLGQEQIRRSSQQFATGEVTGGGKANTPLLACALLSAVPVSFSGKWHPYLALGDTDDQGAAGGSFNHVIGDSAHTIDVQMRNRPALALLQLARLRAFGLEWPTRPDRLQIVSFGTGPIHLRQTQHSAALSRRNA